MSFKLLKTPITETILGDEICEHFLENLAQTHKRHVNGS